MRKQVTPTLEISRFVAQTHQQQYPIGLTDSGSFKHAVVASGGLRHSRWQICKSIDGLCCRHHMQFAPPHSLRLPDLWTVLTVPLLQNAPRFVGLDLPLSVQKSQCSPGIAGGPVLEGCFLGMETGLGERVPLRTAGGICKPEWRAFKDHECSEVSYTALL